MIMSARERKRELKTLDLLGDRMSAVVGAKQLRLFHAHLHPPDLNLRPLDEGLKPAPGFAGSQSVCTIEQVKLALERAERESRGGRGEIAVGRRVVEDGTGSPSPASSITTSSSITAASRKRRAGAVAGHAEMVAAGCPSCLSYVLYSKNSPRCPRCESQVAELAPEMKKRPRIDLNLAL